MLFLFQLNLFVLHDRDVSFSLDLFNDAAHCFKISGKQNREANVMHIRATILCDFKGKCSSNDECCSISSHKLL